MTTPKVEVTTMLAELPDDSDFEDIQYHLYVLEKVKRGLERADHDGAISHETAKARLDKWLATQSGRPRLLKTSNLLRLT